MKSWYQSSAPYEDDLPATSEHQHVVCGAYTLRKRGAVTGLVALLTIFVVCSMLFLRRTLEERVVRQDAFAMAELTGESAGNQTQNISVGSSSGTGTIEEVPQVVKKEAEPESQANATDADKWAKIQERVQRKIQKQRGPSPPENEDKPEMDYEIAEFESQPFDLSQGSNASRQPPSQGPQNAQSPPDNSHKMFGNRGDGHGPTTGSGGGGETLVVVQPSDKLENETGPGKSAGSPKPQPYVPPRTAQPQRASPQTLDAGLATTWPEPNQEQQGQAGSSAAPQDEPTAWPSEPSKYGRTRLGTEKGKGKDQNKSEPTKTKTQEKDQAPASPQMAAQPTAWEPTGKGQTQTGKGTGRTGEAKSTPRPDKPSAPQIAAQPTAWEPSDIKPGQGTRKGHTPRPATPGAPQIAPQPPNPGKGLNSGKPVSPQSASQPGAWPPEIENKTRPHQKREGSEEHEPTLLSADETGYGREKVNTSNYLAPDKKDDADKPSSNKGSKEQTEKQPTGPKQDKQKRGVKFETVDENPKKRE